MAFGRIWTIAIALAVLACVCQGMVVKDQIKNKQANWEFVAKFCFSTAGEGNLTFTASSSSPNARLVFYDDEDDSWPSIYVGQKYRSMSCQALVNASKHVGNGVMVDNTGASQTVLFKDVERPHFWYVAVANCDGNEVDLHYDMTFLNKGGPWEQQFSYDDQGLLPLYMIFFLVFLVIALLHGNGLMVMYRTDSVHPIIKLLTISLFLQLAALFCIFIHYAVYAGDGIGAPGLQAIGDIFDMCSQLVLMLLIIVLSKGWTISTNVLDNRKRLGMIMSVVATLYLILFVWEHAGMNPASTLYVYETAPGIVLLLVRLGVMGWFLYMLRSTMAGESDPTKRKLYILFSILFTLWFFMLPFIVLIAAAVDPWVRHKTVLSLYLVMNTFAFGTLCVLLAPSRATEYFKVSRPDMLAGTTPYDEI